MRKRLTGLLCLTLAAVLLTGCGKQDSSAASVSLSVPAQSAESSENSVPAKADSDAEIPAYEGTFNEAVFEQVCRDIHVADSVITVPGTLEDCGPHFSAEFVLLDKKNELLTYRLLYDGTEIGFVSYDGKARLDKKALETATYNSVFFFNDREGRKDINVGGISIIDPPDKVPEVFGDTTDYRLDDDGFGYWLYKLREGYYLKYTQAGGEIYSIGVTVHPAAGNPNPDQEERAS